MLEPYTLNFDLVQLTLQITVVVSFNNKSLNVCAQSIYYALCSLIVSQGTALIFEEESDTVLN